MYMYISYIIVITFPLLQVLKFAPSDELAPALTLGERFQPASSPGHFCKPTSVAVLPSTGDFFVADG